MHICMYICGSILRGESRVRRGDTKKISKLLNAFGGGKNKRSRRAEILESTRYSGLVGRGTERGKEKTEEGRGRGRKKVARRRRGPRKAHIRSAHILCHMHIYRRVHFRASDPRIGERRLFASRHLVAKPAGLFTYLLLRHTVVYAVLLKSPTSLASLFTFSHSPKNVFAQA